MNQGTVTTRGATTKEDMTDVVRHDLEDTLERRSAKPDTLLRRLEDGTKRGGAHVWATLKEHPYSGAVAATALGIALAASVGVGEVAVGAAVGYAMLRLLKKRKGPLEQTGEPGAM